MQLNARFCQHRLDVIKPFSEQSVHVLSTSLLLESRPISAVHSIGKHTSCHQHSEQRARERAKGGRKLRLISVNFHDNIYRGRRWGRATRHIRGAFGKQRPGQRVRPIFIPHRSPARSRTLALSSAWARPGSNRRWRWRPVRARGASGALLSLCPSLLDVVQWESSLGVPSHSVILNLLKHRMRSVHD